MLKQIQIFLSNRNLSVARGTFLAELRTVGNGLLFNHGVIERPCVSIGRIFSTTMGTIFSGRIFFLVLVSEMAGFTMDTVNHVTGQAPHFTLKFKERLEPNVGPPSASTQNFKICFYISLIHSCWFLISNIHTFSFTLLYC